MIFSTRCELSNITAKEIKELHRSSKRGAKSAIHLIKYLFDKEKKTQQTNNSCWKQESALGLELNAMRKKRTNAMKVESPLLYILLSRLHNKQVQLLYPAMDILFSGG